MKRKITRRVLSMLTAATLAISSFVPSYAAEDVAALAQDDPGVEALTVEEPADDVAAPEGEVLPEMAAEQDAQDVQIDDAAEAETIEDEEAEEADEILVDDDIVSDEEAAEAEDAEAEDAEAEDAEADGESKLFDAEDGVTVVYYLYGSPDGWDSIPKLGYKELCRYATKENKYPALEEEHQKFAELMPGYEFCGWSTYMDYNLSDEDDYFSPLTLGVSEFPADHGEVINVYAHWTSATMPVLINVGTGGHARVELVGDASPYAYIESFYQVSAADHVSDYDYGYTIYLDKGYTVEGLYLDSAYTKPLETQNSSSSYWYFPVTDDIVTMVGGKPVVQLYAKVVEYEVELWMVQRYPSSETKKYEGGKKFKAVDTIPALPDQANINGYDFEGWQYSIPNMGQYHPLEPGVTKFSDASILYDDGVYHVNVYTQWKPVKYTIVFHLNNGKDDITKEEYITDESCARQTSLDVNEHFGVVSQNSSFTDKSLEFSGWALSAKGEVFFDKGLTAESIRKYAYEQKVTQIDVYAKWEGSELYNLQIRAFSDADLEKVDMANESFAGSGYNIVTKEDLVQNDKSYVNETIVLTGNEFVRQGYTLTGWTYEKTVDGKTTTKTLKPSTTIKETAPPEKAVLTANWKIVNYTLKYNLNGGKVTSKDVKTSVTYSKDTVKERIPFLNYMEVDGAYFIDPDNQVVTKTGYTFYGWDTGEVERKYYGGDVYENITLTARWMINTYSVTLDGNGGEVTMANGYPPIPVFLDYNQSYSLKGVTAVRPGYKFKCWTKDIEGKTRPTYKLNATLKNVSTKMGDEVTLYAQWTPVSGTVTYNLRGGTTAVANPTKYSTSTERIELVNPTKPGYKLSGWGLFQKGLKEGEYTASLDWDTESNKFYIAAGSYGDMTLTADYLGVDYDVELVLEMDGMESRSETFTAMYDEPITFDAYARKLETYAKSKGQDVSIVSFTTEKDGTGKKYDTTTAYSKLTDTEGTTVKLYAQCEAKKSYRIFYELDEGILPKRPATYKPSNKSSVQNPTRNGYIFDGWTAHAVVENDPDANMPLSPGVEYTAEEFKRSPEGMAKDLKILKDNNKDLFLVAHWTPVKYTASLDGTEIGKYDYDTEAKYSLGIPKKEGYIYGGVWTAKNGKERRIHEFEDEFTGEISLYMAALTYKDNTKVNLYTYWIPVTKEVEYSGKAWVNNIWQDLSIEDYSYNIGKESRLYTTGKDLTLPRLTVPGYTFLGWKVAADEAPYYTDDLGDIKATVSKTGYLTKINKDNTVDVKLTAVFDENRYSIRLNLAGGTYSTYDASGKEIKQSGKYLVAENLGSVSGAEEAYEALTFFNTYRLKKKGYNVKGIYLDSKGKKPLPDEPEDYEGLVTKNKGVLMAYVVWEKAKPDKPSNVSASLAANKLTISVHDKSAAKVYYVAEYSTSPLFTKGTTNTVYIYTYNDGTVTVSNATGTRYYVRVRAARYDSMSNLYYSAYSAKARAGRTE